MAITIACLPGLMQLMEYATDLVGHLLTSFFLFAYLARHIGHDDDPVLLQDHFAGKSHIVLDCK